MIDTALCLPAADIEALLQGRTVVAISSQDIDCGNFALYSSDTLFNLLPTEQSYRSSFIPMAENAVTQKGLVKAWAKCECCQIWDRESLMENGAIETISNLTVWTAKALQTILEDCEYIFLVYLRVYRLTEPMQIAESVSAEDLFLPLLKPFNIAQENPVLSDRIIQKRCNQLRNLQPPEHPELEELQSAIASLALTNPKATYLDQYIQQFLGWSSEISVTHLNPETNWINTIVAFGTRSITPDEGGSNYHAGTAFENIVRQSLEFIGFTTDESHRGGAGGIDLFCSHPYPLVVECKASKNETIPHSTVEELDRIGRRHLQENYMSATRLIIGPGKPSSHLQEAARISKVSIMNPMTLEKLVKLYAQYPGCIDLFTLKERLSYGQTDPEIEQYCKEVLKEIKLRSHLVKLVRNYLQNARLPNAGVDAFHGAYVGSNPPRSLTTEKMHEILIELSSPLTGYLGREKGEDWKSDRFYFLRDLETPEIES